ncbi:ribose-phosphate diphosphokinase [Desulfonatronovibrio magnus]|uniref:ribose-phosphate diphosphokinase n=1 Tax=Desulfonatronovibrio magnus TaxID=698827 RepID=UPI0005EB8E56|nr:ribose-phosphate diphosphokinase [Desulfonatronovibrio magnus]
MITLFSSPCSHDLARSICLANPSFLRGDISWLRFRDGFPDLKINDALNLTNRHVVFLACLESSDEIFRQLSVIYELPRLAVKSLKVVLPYFPTGTMERVDEEGEVATAATLARMLSIIPGTMSGPVEILIYDIHALQERFYFSDQVIPRLVTAIPLLLKRIRALKNVAIAFPDDGSLKRFGKMFENYPIITALKIRDKDCRKVVIKEGDPRGKHVIIVDDLVMTGGTLLRCQEALKKAGASEVSAFVTHGVFPQQSWKRFVDHGFTKFWMTDSCPKTVEMVKNYKPFEVISLAEDIAAKVFCE